MDLKELTQHGFDAWNARDEEAFLARYVTDCEIVAPGFVQKGHQGLRLFWAAWNGAFPDNRLFIRKIIVEGHDIAISAHASLGTHSGPLMRADGSEIPPTGRQADITYALFNAVRNDKIVTSTIFLDQLDLMTQLGLA